MLNISSFYYSILRTNSELIHPAKLVLDVKFLFFCNYKRNILVIYNKLFIQIYNILAFRNILTL